VDYRLTPLGESLGEALCGVWVWVEAHRDEVERFRREYDGG
jgi:DNA-binding HxlR family transcriptional regulator